MRGYEQSTDRSESWMHRPTRAHHVPISKNSDLTNLVRSERGPISEPNVIKKMSALRTNTEFSETHRAQITKGVFTQELKRSGEFWASQFVLISFFDASLQRLVRHLEADHRPIPATRGKSLPQAETLMRGYGESTDRSESWMHRPTRAHHVPISKNSDLSTQSLNRMSQRRCLPEDEHRSLRNSCSANNKGRIPQV